MVDRERVVGIDLGLTNSVVALLDRGSPEIIPNSEGGRLTPSVVAFSPEKGILVGSLAKRQAITNAENTVMSVRRHMGTNWSRTFNGRTYTATDITAEIIKKLKQDAEDYLGEPVTRAVITIPAYFNQSQRQATLEAGQIAGLKVERIIPEPTAAAIAISVQVEDPDETYLIFDLDQGTLDVTILESRGGEFEVRSTSGDTQLGGDDWDEAIVHHLLEEFRLQTGVNISGDLTAMQRIKEATQNARIELSTLAETFISLPFITSGKKGPISLEATMTRATFEKISRHLVDRCAEPIHRALEDSGILPYQIDQVVLVGEGTRMPAIHQLINQLVGKEPRQSIHPEEVVAVGAAIQAGIINQEVKDVVLLDVAPFSLWLRATDGLTERLIKRNTPYPCSVSITLATSSSNQEQIGFELFQGELEKVNDNIRLANLVMSGLPWGPKGSVRVDCTFDIDAHGVIHVTAKEQRTGKTLQETLNPSELSWVEMERMRAEAERIEEEDRQKKIDQLIGTDTLGALGKSLIAILQEKEENSQSIEELSQISEEYQKTRARYQRYIEQALEPVDYQTLIQLSIFDHEEPPKEDKTRSRKWERVVGIDLGITNSVIAIVDPDDPAVLPNAEGKRLTPSIVAFSSTDTLVGDLAKRQASTNPENTVRSIKREMGKDDWFFSYNGKRYIPQEISARILMKLKRDAEAYLNEEISKAVIAVPAYFNSRQRQATQDAGQIAGLDVVRIINEPTAAVVAYGYKDQLDQTVLVFDLDGGTLDISVLEKVGDTFEVKATSGDNHLGGDDWDKVIADWLVYEFKAKTGVDLGADPSAMQRLIEAAETAKIELSTLTETTINLPFIAADRKGPLNLEEYLSRAQFEKMTKHLLDRCREPFQNALSASGKSLGEIAHVIMVGGSTRMPAVRELITQLTGKDPRQGINPDEAVAAGAALHANSLVNTGGKSILLLDVTPLNLGIEGEDGRTNLIIERNTTIPASKSFMLSTTSDNQTTVEVHVVQGQREMANDNTSLGKFQLKGIRKARKGVPKIEFNFSINSNGILEVSAEDKETGNTKVITITGANKLSQDEIQQMISDAKTHQIEDERKKELGTQRHRAERIIGDLEAIMDYDHKQRPDHQMPKEMRADLYRKLADLNDAVISDRIGPTKLEETITQAQELLEDYWNWRKDHTR